MKVAQQGAPRGGKHQQGGSVVIVPPIPLQKLDESAYVQGSYMTVKLRSVPADDKSPTHEIQVPYFKSGTAEQLLDFIDKVTAVCVGQNFTDGPQKFAFMRQVLKGDALSHWHTTTAALPNNNENNAVRIYTHPWGGSRRSWVYTHAWG